MKLVSINSLLVAFTAILTTHAVASVSDEKLRKFAGPVHQRALTYFAGAKQSLSFRRHLVSDECYEGQSELDTTGINDSIVDEEVIFEVCEFTFDDDLLSMVCDFAGITIDSGMCSEVNGRIVTLNFSIDCDLTYMSYSNLSLCLHETCDVEEYEDIVEEELDAVDDDPTCTYSVTIIGEDIDDEIDDEPLPTPKSSKGPKSSKVPKSSKGPKSSKVPKSSKGLKTKKGSKSSKGPKSRRL